MERSRRVDTSEQSKERQKEEALSFDIDVEEEDVDEATLEKIKNDLQWKIIGHPLTLYPLVLGIGSLSYAIIPVFGGLLVAVSVGIAGLVFGVGNGGLRLFHVGEKYAIKKSEFEAEYVRKRDAEEKRKIDHSVQFLLKGFQGMNGTVNARQGARAGKELEQLVDAFKQVDQEIVQHQRSMFDIHLGERVSPLVKDAYKQGLRVLACVRELLRDDPSLDRTTLKREIGELENEIEGLRNEGERQRFLETKEKALTLRKQRLEKADWRDATVESLIYQSDVCEEVLRSTREDLIKLRMEQSEGVLEDMLRRIQGCIATLLKVQEEFTRSKEGLSI